MVIPGAQYLMRASKTQLIVICVAVGLAVVVAAAFVVWGDTHSQLSNLKGTDPVKQEIALRELSEGKETPEVTQAVILATANKNAAVAARALYVLDSRTSPAQPMSSERLVAVMAAAKDERPKVREVAMTVIAAAGSADKAPADATTILMESFKNKNETPEVRAAAARSLAQMQHWDAMYSLVEAWDDPSLVVRGGVEAAMQHMIVVDYGYRAGDTRDKRAVAIAKISTSLEWLHKGHTLWRGRVNERESKP